MGNRSNASMDRGSVAAVANASGSDTEAPLRFRGQNYPYPNPPPGLTAPPGLEHLVGDRYEPPRQDVNMCFNVEAKYARTKQRKVSVPKASNDDQKLQECLRYIAASSEHDLASSNLEEVINRRLQREQHGLQKDSLSRLDEVRGKVTVDDSAIAKVAPQLGDVSCATTQPQTMRFPSSINIAEDNTLRSILGKLAEVDAGHVFMVRKIKKLGSNSQEMLTSYFSKFGRVENVYVTPTPDKRSHVEDPQAKPIIRGPGMAFIVMEKIDDVVNIFQHGLEHTILGVRTSLGAYEHHIPKGAECNSPSDHTIKPRGLTERPYINLTKDNTLRSNLRKLAEIDDSLIIMVKKINKLGLGSPQLLETHFGQFGIVTHVFVAHTIDRSSTDPENPIARPHVRPAGIGFIVMEKVDNVAAAFQNGFEQSICGVNIKLAKYKPQIPATAIADNNGLET